MWRQNTSFLTLVHQEVKDAGIIYCRCGISRPTLCKWVKRYKERGEEGLKELSRRPHTSPKSEQQEKLLSNKIFRTLEE